RSSGGDPDAAAPEAAADDQLSRARSGDPARRGTERRARCHGRPGGFLVLRLRRSERVPGDDAGAGMTGKAIPNRVLVTGGGRGIGAAIVRTLAAGGHDVLFTYRTDERVAQALAAEVAGESGRAIDIARLDLGDRAAVDAFAGELAGGEPFYGFVHNAGQSY